jgi:hypothetical protein
MVAMNVIGHFNQPQRIRMWRLLTERLAPGGHAVLNLLPPTTAVAVPEDRGSTVVADQRATKSWPRHNEPGPEPDHRLADTGDLRRICRHHSTLMGTVLISPRLDVQMRAVKGSRWTVSSWNGCAQCGT